MVYVKGRYCKWCTKLEREILNDAKVIRAAKDYIPVRIVQEENFAALKALPRIMGVPTVFFLSPDRRVLTTAFGYYGKEDFLSFFPEAEREMKKRMKTKDENISLVWHDDIDEAFETAKKEGKYVVVMVEDIECRWCKMVKRESLSKPEVKRTLSHFVLLRILRSDIDIDRLPELRGPIPSFHLFDANRTKLDALYGYFDAEYLESYFKTLKREF
jgi:thioredoxin-related protein